MARNAPFAASPSGNPGTGAAFRPAERLGDELYTAMGDQPRAAQAQALLASLGAGAS